MRKMLASVALASMVLSAQATAGEPKQAKASQAEQLQRKAMSDVPRCTRKLGTVSVIDGDDPYGWTQFSLQPPAKLIKVLVQRSGCFNLVDRGAGLTAAQTERDIGSSLGLQQRSNVGQGQIKAADYVIVAEVQGANNNAQGSGAAGAIGGLLGGPIGGLLGGIRSKKMEANTVLSLTNVRTTETLAAVEGYAAKNDVAFGGGGGGWWGSGAMAAVGGGYDNTDIGRIVTLAFLDAYAKLVTEMGGIGADTAGTAEATPVRTFTANGPSAMRTTPAAGGAVVLTLPAGAIVYPTGKQEGLWWEVADENDNVGWVLNTKFSPSR